MLEILLGICIIILLIMHLRRKIFYARSQIECPMIVLILDIIEVMVCSVACLAQQSEIGRFLWGISIGIIIFITITDAVRYTKYGKKNL